MTDNAELRGLISAKRWLDVVERVELHPHEVGPSPSMRDDEGYTVLHTILGYANSTSGTELVPAVRAILRAADEIDWGCVIDDNPEGHVLGANELSSREGSWRLLLDQANSDFRSPMHVVCFNDGCVCALGKVPLMRVLLQMDDYEYDGGVDSFQHRILTLLDRQHRNVLHLFLCTGNGPRADGDDLLDAIRFAVSMAPALLFQRDLQNNTPLDSLLILKRSNDLLQIDLLQMLVNRRYHLTLKVLVDNNMEQNTRGYGGVRPKNVLQSACLLPRNTCPSDGSLLSYLCSADASELETWARESASAERGRRLRRQRLVAVNMASEADERGNLALHLLLSNESYVHGGNTEIATGDDTEAHLCTLEHKNVMSLLTLYHEANLTPNGRGDLPLQIAMKAGRRRAMPGLLTSYPVAAFSEESLHNIKFYVSVLGCISVPARFFHGRGVNDVSYDEERHANNVLYITTMYALVRARPDIVSLAGGGIPKSDE